MEPPSNLKLHVLTVGEWQENCYLLMDPETNEGLLIDPGGEPVRILAGKLELLYVSSDVLSATAKHARVGLLTSPKIRVK